VNIELILWKEREVTGLPCTAGKYDLITPNYHPAVAVPVLLL
jgi:hypothetical protein